MAGQMWFGTEERARWIPAPKSGADATPQSWLASGTLLGGGGYSFSSFGSHRMYAYAWSDASSRRAAQIMQSYRDGTYGRGLLYFVEPTTYDMNILPKHWADPSLALDDEAPAIIRSFDPELTSIQTSEPMANDLPSRSVRYELNDDRMPIGYPGPENSLFIPVPPGFTLQLGAFYTAEGAGGVFVGAADAPSVASTPTKLEPVGNTDSIIMNTTVQGGSLNGVRLWIGRDGSGPAAVTIAALVARLVPLAKEGVVGPAQRGPWVGGQGHSGCRFEGHPTYVTHNGVGGGQVGYAATFREVGSWEYV